jgi:hypothetical protein
MERRLAGLPAFIAILTSFALIAVPIPWAEATLW